MDGNLNKDLDENLAWLTEKTEDPKSNKGNLNFLPQTVNVIELNCKVIKKVATPTFLHPPPPPFSGLSPLSRKTFCTPSPQVTQFLEGPTPSPLIGVGVGGGGEVQLCQK